jgi:hypothetical protein
MQQRNAYSKRPVYNKCELDLKAIGALGISSILALCALINGNLEYNY